MKKILTTFVVCLLLTFISTYSKPVEAATLKKQVPVQNLIVNGDCSQGLDGWTVTKGAWTILKESQIEGYPAKSFWPKPGQKYSSMYQDVDISEFSEDTPLVLSCFMHSYKQTPNDEQAMSLCFLDSEKNEISRESFSNSEYKDYWFVASIEAAIPTSAAYARVILEGTLRCGTDVNTNFGNITLGVKDSGYILDLEPRKQDTQVSKIVQTNLFINNISEIAAEDVYIKYDTNLLQFVGYEEANGIKLVYSKENAGVIRVILASKGEANIAQSKKTLLKLKFKALNPGEALVDITKGRISDGIEMEENVPEEKCGYCNIIIKPSPIPDDVNHTGEFTLLDLAIDARHLHKNPNSEELLKYNTDIAVNNAIDEDDLLEIGKYMLENKNYPFNTL